MYSFHRDKRGKIALSVAIALITRLVTLDGGPAKCYHYALSWSHSVLMYTNVRIQAKHHSELMIVSAGKW